MKPDVAVDELIEHFTLLPPEITFLGRNDPHNQLGKALLLKFFQAAGRFPESEHEFTPAIIEYVAQQLRLPPASFRPTTGMDVLARISAIRFGNCWAFIQRLSLTKKPCAVGSLKQYYPMNTVLSIWSN